MAEVDQQYNNHGYYINLSYSCGCCGTSTNAYLDDVMAEFDRVGAGVHTLYLDGYHHTNVDTSQLFSLHCQPRLGETTTTELTITVETWIDEWKRKWHKKHRVTTH